MSPGRPKSSERIAILALQKKLKEKDDKIMQLQKANDDLKSELELEKGIVQVYVDRLERVEEQWMSRMRTLKGFVNDVNHVLHPQDNRSTFACSNEEKISNLESDYEEALPSSSLIYSDTKHLQAIEFVDLYISGRQQDPHAAKMSYMNPANSEIENASVDTAFDQNHRPALNVFREDRNDRTFGGDEMILGRVCLSKNEIREDCFASTHSANVEAHQTQDRQEIYPTIDLESYKQYMDSKANFRKQPSVHQSSIPGFDWTQRLLLLKESFEKRKAIFVDDLCFIREVHCGLSFAPEMDIEVELKNLDKRFKIWKAMFKEEMKSAEFQIKHCIKGKGISNLASKRESKYTQGSHGRKYTKHKVTR